MSIQVGDTVRSFDFDGRTDCYVDGIVEAIGPVAEFRDCDRYTIRVTCQVFAGKPQAKHTPHVYPPVNGTPKLFGGVCNGVQKNEPEQADGNDSL